MNDIQRSVARYVDGEMSRDEAIAFEVRLRDDVGLRQAVSDLGGLRTLFGPERASAGPRPSDGFRGRVLAAAAAADSSRGPEPAEVEVWARRVLCAAAVIVAGALVLAFGVLSRADTGRLEAAPAEVRRSMDALDARIRAAEQSAAESAEGR